jgi:ABC-type sugar transport system permease subunit
MTAITIVWAIASVIGLVLYIVPILVAKKRNCKAFSGIVIVNIFLGWSLLGWVAALVWAAVGEPKPESLTA